MLKSNFRKLHRVHCNSFPKFFSSTKIKSTLELLKERNQKFVDRVDSKNYTQNDFSNFLRIVSQQSSEERLQILKRELPNNLERLDEKDMRKVSSTFLKHEQLYDNQDLVQKIKKRHNSFVMMEKDILFPESKKGKENFETKGLKFYMFLFRTREKLFRMIRRVLNISIK